MEKGLKIVKTIAILLIAALIALVAFVGVYVQKNGIWENILQDYKLGMELGGFRELHYVLDDSEEEKEVYVDSEGNYKGDVEEKTETAEITATTEEGNQIAEEAEVESQYQKETRVIKANEDSAINIENFEKSKKIIQKRLESLNSYEYNIRQDSVTGEIIIEVPNDENVEVEQFLISTVGNVSIVDYQTGEILIDNSSVKHATLLSSNSTTYQAYLQIEFNEIGKEKLKEISNKYVAVTGDNETETINYVSVKLDDSVLVTTYFGEELDTGILQIPMGQATSDYDEFLSVVTEVENIVEIINGESMPLVYVLSSDNYIQSLISDKCILIAKIVFAVLILMISIYFIIKYKFEGIKATIFSLGYIGLLSLAIRYTNVTVTLNSIIAGIGAIVINYVFYIKILSKIKAGEVRKIALLNVMKQIYLAIVPVCIIALIFTFMSSVVINSIGMTLFWGLFIQALCSFLVLI